MSNSLRGLQRFLSWPPQTREQFIIYASRRSGLSIEFVSEHIFKLFKQWTSYNFSP